MSRANDLQIYERHAHAWWDQESRVFRSLRSVGRFHVACMQAEWGQRLLGARVVDLGCGGGGVSLQLAAAGAEVLGLDLSSASVQEARRAASAAGLQAEFQVADLRDTGLADRCADFVVLSDVIEHLEDPEAALAEAARLLKPGGELFLNTFDRTRWSRLLVVTVAEGLGLVPRGTHDGRLFVRPGEIQALAWGHGLQLTRVQRERPSFWRTLRHWTIHLQAASSGPGYHAFMKRDAS